MNNTLENEVKTFLESRIGMRLNNDVKLFTDIGIDGYDASILMREFGAHFGIEMSDFKESRYFSNEHGLMNFPRRIVNFWFKGKESYYFDLEHCYDVVRKKKWFDKKTNK